MQNETTLIVGVVVAVMALVGYMITKGINIATNVLKAQTDNKNLESLIDRVNRTALIVVQSLNQTLVDDLKAKSEDGTLTKEEIGMIKEKAMDSLLNNIGKEGRDLLGNAFGDVNAYLRDLIEAKVGEAKALRKK